MVDGLVKKYSGRYDMKVVNLSNGDAQDRVLAQSYGVEYVPTFVFLNRDGSVSSTKVGSLRAEQIEAELAKLQ